MKILRFLFFSGRIFGPASVLYTGGGRGETGFPPLRRSFTGFSCSLKIYCKNVNKTLTERKGNANSAVLEACIGGGRGQKVSRRSRRTRFSGGGIRENFRGPAGFLFLRQREIPVRGNRHRAAGVPVRLSGSCSVWSEESPNVSRARAQGYLSHCLIHDCSALRRGYGLSPMPVYSYYSNILTGKSVWRNQRRPLTIYRGRSILLLAPCPGIMVWTPEKSAKSEP